MRFKQNNTYQIFWLFTLLMAVGIINNSCNKTDPSDCFKATGPNVTEKRTVALFKKIILRDNVCLVLTQDSNYSVTVMAGEKIMPKVITTITDEVLDISNANSCNWVRSFEREITVYANVDVLNEIEYRGSGDITCTNTIVQDSLTLGIVEGAGKVDMDVDIYRNYIYFHIGTADVYYSGKSHLNYLSTLSFGLVDIRNMNTVYTYMTAAGSNNTFVNAGFELNVRIESMGDVYYIGDPEINLSGTGTGELLKL
ncbi:MAG: hypothetical protein B7C24_07510 [Bacteroidetes bacterium 4572_77]|nr:MAG: hypothetical protein B7C24_07510 [Bacteroidetes bacterium 4572_77]